MRLLLAAVLTATGCATPLASEPDRPVVPVAAAAAAPAARVAPRASRGRGTSVPQLRPASGLPATASTPPLLVLIRSCESGAGSGRADDVDWTAQNGASSASGGYQVTDGTWHHYLGYAHARQAPAAVQSAFARQLYVARGSQPWDASRRCWAR